MPNKVLYFIPPKKATSPPTKRCPSPLKELHTNKKRIAPKKLCGLISSQAITPEKIETIVVAIHIAHPPVLSESLIFVCF